MYIPRLDFPRTKKKDLLQKKGLTLTPKFRHKSITKPFLPQSPPLQRPLLEGGGGQG